ncbi:efflux RND transporter periplasmic adaptor subunit [Adhaeribacter swui]|uniref:Efflux RND transporter periplasmic adaptor subunit n=1 Tax=Adhaeribacter swui TaxID=2086471 RepID=A0A7G7G436_9BACT|nr:efflux RND transporter periplasmic adaptor subunit [Adhaeribacter swui]QNF31920.1 efflux RND transporter periplasmic adaptor subunit [Adhaeribacter swui]
MNKYSILLLLSFLILNSCSKSENTEEPKNQGKATAQQAAAPNPDQIKLTPEQVKNIGIVLGSASEQTLGTTLQLSGEVDVPPSGLISISVPYGGFLRQTSMIPGAQVHKGQVLAILEHPDYVQIQQDYLDTKTKIELAQQEYARQQELVAEKISAAKNVQQVRAELQLLKNNQAALRQKLLMINVNPEGLTPGKISRTISLQSPINGFVKNVNANVGKMISANDILFELVNTDELHIELNAFEKDISKLKPGQKFSFRLPNEQKDRLAEISLVGQSVQGDNIIPVHGHLLQKDPKLLPGMFVTASIQTGQKETTILPETAVVQLEGKKYIFVEEQANQFKKIPVETGIKNQDKIEVNLPEILKNSDKIAIKGAHNLLAILAKDEE